MKSGIRWLIGGGTLSIILFLLFLCSGPPTGRLMSKTEIDMIIRTRNLEDQIPPLVAHCRHLYSTEAIRECLAFTYVRFPPALQPEAVKFVERTMDIAAAKEMPFDKVTCLAVEAVMAEPQGCPD